MSQKELKMEIQSLQICFANMKQFARQKPDFLVYAEKQQE